jgi:hypothetical protein
MGDPISHGVARERNSLVPLPVSDLSRARLPLADSQNAGPRHPGLVDHPLVTPEVQFALLAAVDETACAELGDLVDAIPDHPQPLSAVLALVDAGLIGLEFNAPFDRHLRVWRILA